MPTQVHAVGPRLVGGWRVAAEINKNSLRLRSRDSQLAQLILPALERGVAVFACLPLDLARTAH